MQRRVKKLCSQGVLSKVSDCKPFTNLRKFRVFPTEVFMFLNSRSMEGCLSIKIQPRTSIGRELHRFGGGAIDGRSEACAPWFIILCLFFDPKFNLFGDVPATLLDLLVIYLRKWVWNLPRLYGQNIPTLCLFVSICWFFSTISCVFDFFLVTLLFNTWIT